jgi:hypothetical protein
LSWRRECPPRIDNSHVLSIVWNLLASRLKKLETCEGRRSVSAIDIEELREQLELLFNPEPDDDGLPLREYPNSRLRDTLRLNFDYMNSFDWEGSSGHKYTRLAPENESQVRVLTRSQDMPERLFISALRLMADSILEYHAAKERHSEIRYYPPIVLTAWAGFETYIRHMSELLIVTARELPADIVRFLREEEVSITPKGEMRIRSNSGTGFNMPVSSGESTIVGPCSARAMVASAVTGTP